jgi:DnaK suppressor protein
MEKAKLEQLRARLWERKQQIVRHMNASRDYGLAVAECPQDLAERASALASRELFFAHNTQEQRLLRLVEEALQRVSDGSYGQCAACASPIQVKRLQAVPWARYCLACQERAELRREPQARAA